MRVLHVSDTLAVDHGGTSAACAQLANHLGGAGVESSVLTIADGHRTGSTWPLDGSVAHLECHPTAPHPLAFCADLSAVMSTPPRANLVHIHGLWRLHYAQAARFAFKERIPVLMSVHGMLHPLALAEKATSKRIARWLYQDDLLRRAACLHVTASSEADEVRGLGFTGPLAVIPWGVDVPPDEEHRDDQPEDQAGEPVHTQRATGSAVRRVLYLGRLRPAKGVDTLLRAWARVSKRFPAWRLVIAGFDTENYRSSLSALASELNVGASIDWAGPVEGADRERVFRDAELLVLPSSFENFGLVVAEALVRGLPVVATYGAPWSALVDEACGWWIPTGVDPLAATLTDALAESPARLHAMGARGRHYARSRFSWDDTARSMRTLYCWMLGGGPMPPFVRV